MTTTCQICGRAIKAKNGRIAHHGYTQPWLRFGDGDGSRTASCAGTRELPYEVSRDAILRVRQDYLNGATHTEAQQDKLLAEPPATIEYQPRDAWGRSRGPKLVFKRPEGFDPHAVGRPYSSMHTYATQFDNRVRKLGEVVRQLRWSPMGSAAYLQARYDGWVAPAEEVAP